MDQLINFTFTERVYMGIITTLVILIVYLISDISAYRTLLKRCKGLLGNFTWKAEKDIEKALQIENLRIGGIYTSTIGVKVKIVDAVVNDQGVLYILYIFIHIGFEAYDDGYYTCCSCEKFKCLFK